MTPFTGSARKVLRGSVLYGDPLISGYHPVRSLPLKMGTHVPEFAPSPPEAASPAGLTIASVVEAMPALPPEPVVGVIEPPQLLPDRPHPFQPPTPCVLESPTVPP